MEHEGTVAAVDDRVTDEQLAARVALGVVLLDREIPGWWREDHEPAVNVPRLAMWSARWCVLGMLGGFWYWTSRFGIGAEPYGFALTTAEAAFDTTAYDRLTIAWRAEITGRRLKEWA